MLKIYTIRVQKTLNLSTAITLSHSHEFEGIYSRFSTHQKGHTVAYGSPQNCSIYHILEKTMAISNDSNLINDIN